MPAPAAGPPPGSGRSAGRPREPEQGGHGHLAGCRPVPDVLARERRLVHRGPHVARVEGVDPQLRLLRRQHRGELVERRLGRPVAAPAGVRLDGGVGGQTSHDRARRAARSCGSRAWTERERRDDADLEHPPVAPSGRSARPAAGSARARWRCSPAAARRRPGRRRGQAVPVHRVRDVPAGRRRSPPVRRAARASAPSPRRRHHHLPAPRHQAPGECLPETSGRTGHHGHRCVVLRHACYAPASLKCTSGQGGAPVDSRDLLPIGDVAHRRSGFATSALRYYEQEGVICLRAAPPAASAATSAACCAGWRSCAPRRASGSRWRRSASALADPAGRAPADEGRLGPALPRLAPPPRRADRRAGGAAGRPQLLHRLRLPLAAPLRPVQPARPRGRPRPGRAATSRRRCAVRRAAPERGPQHRRPDPRAWTVSSSIVDPATSRGSSGATAALDRRRRRRPRCTRATDRCTSRRSRRQRRRERPHRRVVGEPGVHERPAAAVRREPVRPGELRAEGGHGRRRRAAPVLDPRQRLAPPAATGSPG